MQRVADRCRDSSLREVERYVAAASQMKLADDAMAAIKSGTKFGQPGASGSQRQASD
jgi:hypothetical protein